MGKKGGRWFGVVKRVFGAAESKEKNSPESKEKDCEISEYSESDENLSGVQDTAPKKSSPERDEFENAESEESRHAYSVALASAVAAEAAAVAAKAAAEVVRLTQQSARFACKSREENAAIKIQTSYRGHLARRALRALRGLARLKELTKSNSVKNQTAATLQCMQTLARVQSQIRSRRIRMTEENQALQKQLQLKHERELEKNKISEEWDTSLQTKEQLEATLHNKQEAALRRERAMAYAFSHQLKNSSKSNPILMDPNNPQWGWSWLERWMAARPWESRNAAERELSLDHASLMKIAKTNARRDTNLDRPSSTQKSRPISRHSLSLPPTKIASVTRKVDPASPKAAEDETRSPVSMQSERHRRNSSVAGLSTMDDAGPMSSTRMVKPKSRLRTFSVDMSDNALESGSPSSAKKRLSNPATSMSSPTAMAARRHSGPPKVDVSSLKNNGGGK